MQLPVDAREAPYRDKYITEETAVLRHWFVLGEDPSDGTVFVSDGTDDVLCGLSRQDADRIVAARDVLIEVIREVYCTPRT